MAASVAASMDAGAMTLAAIEHRQFKLRPTVTNDRSAPVVDAGSISTSRILAGSRDEHEQAPLPQGHVALAARGAPTPPPPPPAAPAPLFPATSSGGRRAAEPDTGALFAHIRQGGHKLRKVAHVSDRSAPVTGAADSPSATQRARSAANATAGLPRNPNFLLELQSKVGAKMEQERQDSHGNTAPAKHAVDRSIEEEPCDNSENYTAESAPPIEMATIPTKTGHLSADDDKPHSLLINAQSDSSSLKSAELCLASDTNSCTLWDEPAAEQADTMLRVGGEPQRAGASVQRAVDKSVAITVTPATPVPCAEDSRGYGGDTKRSQPVLFHTMRHDTDDEATKHNGVSDAGWKPSDSAPKAFTPSQPRSATCDDEPPSFQPYLGLGGAPKPLPERTTAGQRALFDFSFATGKRMAQVEKRDEQPPADFSRSVHQSMTCSEKQPALAHSQSTRIIPVLVQQRVALSHHAPAIAPTLPHTWAAQREPSAQGPRVATAGRGGVQVCGSAQRGEGVQQTVGGRVAEPMQARRPLAGSVSSAKKALFEAANNVPADDGGATDSRAYAKPLTARSIIQQFEESAATAARRDSLSRSTSNDDEDDDAIPKVGKLRNVFEAPGGKKQRAKSIATVLRNGAHPQQASDGVKVPPVTVQRAYDTDCIGSNGVAVRNDYGKPDVNELVNRFNQSGNVGTLTRRHRPKWASTRPPLQRVTPMAAGGGPDGATATMSSAQWLEHMKQKHDSDMADREREATERTLAALQQMHRDFRFNINLDDSQVISFAPAFP